MPWYIIILGIVIILVLAAVAWRLQSRVYQMENRQKQQAEVLHQQQEKHQQYLNNSIQVLAQGIVDEQLSLTEGAIRISVLLDNLNITAEEKQTYSAFFQLAEATAHIPVLKAWKALPKKEKLRYDKERLGIEDKFKSFVVDAAERIRGQAF